MLTCPICGLLGPTPCRWCPKMNETNQKSYEHETVLDSALQKLDWHRHEYPLGVRTSLTEHAPSYNALTAEELEVLHAALTKVLPGAETSIARMYLGLSELATGAGEVAKWAKRHP